jgi:hypothetical protein
MSSEVLIQFTIAGNQSLTNGRAMVLTGDIGSHRRGSRFEKK